MLEVKNRVARFFQACPDSSEYLGSDKYSLPKPEIPTGGRLYHFHKAWEKIKTDQWTQSVIRNRYRIQFRVRPKLSRVVPQFLRRTPTDPEKIRLLESEVQSMLDKHAIEPVSSDHPKSGFYSRLFLVRKKSGGWRPVIDLSRLNRHVITPHFKMETLDSVRLSLRKHDWAISLDLTDAYFHIPIHPKSRRYLRFHFMGKTYQFRALAFGLAPAPYVFSRIVKAVVKHFSTHGYASSFIPRRLAPAVSVSSCVSVSQRSTSEYGVVPGICSQLRQVGASSQSEIFFPGSSFLSRQGAYRSIFGQAHEATIINTENVVSWSCISPTDPFPVGSNGVNGSSFARWQSSQAFAPVAYQGPLGSSRPTMGLSHFRRSLVQPGRFSMAQQGLPVFHGTFMSASSRLVSVHGCESGWLGSSYGRPISFWPMVCPLAGSAHKFPGTKSSHAGSEILSSGNSALSCIAVNRQYDRSGLPEQRRGFPVTNPVIHGDQSARLVHEATCVFNGKVCTWEAERSGRLPLQERADSSHRVDPSQGHPVSDFSILGDPPLRSVRHEAEQSIYFRCLFLHFTIHRHGQWMLCPCHGRE